MFVSLHVFLNCGHVILVCFCVFDVFFSWFFEFGCHNQCSQLPGETFLLLNDLLLVVWDVKLSQSVAGFHFHNQDVGQNGLFSVC